MDSHAEVPEMITLEERMGLLLVRVAICESDSRMSGVYGPGWGFCSDGYPEIGSSAGFGDNQLEAAINY